jgi:hypothetical protein
LTLHHIRHVIQAQWALAQLLNPVTLGGIQAWPCGAEQVIIDAPNAATGMDITLGQKPFIGVE